MNHPLTAEQRQEMRTELSRRYHLLLADLDKQISELGERQLSIAEYTEQYNAIETTRQMLKAEWEKELKQYDA